MTVLALSCNKDANKTAATDSGTGTGSIAIVDLDAVAKAMGWADDMTNNLKQTQASVAEQFKTFLRPSQLVLENKRDEITKADNLSAPQIESLNNAKSKTDLEKLGLTPKQIEELGQAFATAYNENAGANQRLQQIVAAQRDEIVKRYREAVKPSVRRVAIANNKSVVLMPGGDILYYDKPADLSDKVIDDLQHTNTAKVDLPPIPHLQIEVPPSTAPSKK
jgi:hypothetical protein